MQEQDWLIREMIKIKLCPNNMSRENRFSLSSFVSLLSTP
jgi:hypothetical protein